MEEDCGNEAKCTIKRTIPHFQEFSIYTKERRKSWKGSITFLEARKIVESSMKENIYVNVGQKASTISNDHQPNKSRAFIKTPMQLRLNDWPKFQKQLKKLNSAEICPTKSQIKQN